MVALAARSGELRLARSGGGGNRGGGGVWLHWRQDRVSSGLHAVAAVVAAAGLMGCGSSNGESTGTWDRVVLRLVCGGGRR